MNHFPWLSILTLVPVVGACLALLAGKRRGPARAIAAASALVSLAITIYLWTAFNTASGTMQFQELHAWMPALGVEYHLAIDGLGLLMIALSAIVVLISIASSWSR